MRKQAHHGFMNGYQKSKARAIAAVLILGAAASDTPMAQLPVLAAHMTADQWRTIAFQAGQANVDEPAKVLTIAYLLKVSA